MGKMHIMDNPIINFKAAIFDLDGTLLDSLGLWEKIDIDFLAKRGLSVTEAYKDKISSCTFREAAEYTIFEFHLNERVEDIRDEWNQMAYDEYSNHVKLKPYAKEYLTKLKSQGIKLATATSLSRELAAPVLKNNGIYNYFDAQCFTDDVKRGKESPDVYQLAAQKLAVPNEQCVVFEDLLLGIVSAKKIGMKVFAMDDPHTRAEEIEIRKAADGYLYDFKTAPYPFRSKD
jgi:HAD superfamily hydrolase (TIGR01509 family)